MPRMLRVTVVTVMLLALASAGPRAQGTAGQKPPSATAKPDPAAQAAAAQAKPAEIAPEDYPPDFKAFNEAGKEKDAQKRAQAMEKFIADNPKSMLVSVAKSQIQSAVAAAFRDARKKYLDMVKTRIDAAKASETLVPAYNSYNSAASEMFNAGLYEEAEEYARTGLSLMDEQKYIEMRKQAAQRMLDAAAKRAASPSPSPSPDATGGLTYSVSMSGGVISAKPVRRTAAPATAKPPAPQPIPTEQQLRTSFRSEKAGAQATLGQILLKRGKTEEGERILKEAFAARPASSTMATIARLLMESAKKAGDDKAQLEYLTVLALSGRITAAERQQFDGAFRKTHGGSLDGIEEMLDERYRRENTRFEVTPFARKSPPTGRAVLVEMFTGAG